MTTFKNPIIPGCYADPSICRVGDDYYLIASTFEYFPGVPIFNSKDLVNWRQIGHVLDRPSQLNLDGTPNSKGIYAATIRYHKGIFYMITTFVESATGERRNFFVTAENPEGPWSDPYWLEDCPGIDSSLFFDDDGKAYITANRRPPSGQDYPKHMEIWMQELDLETKQLVGEKYSLWDGALKQIHAQEAPHIYKVEGMYYLIIAEGGTGFTHSVTIARSESITGPYEGSKTNPILTHRHLGRDYPIANIGHADIVETQNGEWWMVCLGSRPYGGKYRNLGRESFLVPFIWENSWPVVNPGKGIVEMEGVRPHLEEKRWQAEAACDHFDSDTLGMQWNFIRTPREDFWSLGKRLGHLRLYAKPETMTEEVNPSFIGRRQQHINFAVRTKMEFQPNNEQEVAGLVLLQNQDFQYRLEIAKSEIKLIKRESGKEQILAAHDFNKSEVFLKVEAYGQNYQFYFAENAEQWKILYGNADGRILSTDVAGGFVGTYIGMFASSNGFESTNYVDIDYFEYIGLT
ncbi:glycoside hydrolase family 43 protein [Bacillus sp. FSL K6-3431]|uniref:glycoside hydrolase family 43 protein n=1 Tax=Bacillus sp. FSL K6-3431 TaxID=2921500 RepID=UPI0030FD20C8